MIERGPYINIWGDPDIADNVEVGAYTEIGRGVVIGKNTVIAAMCFIPPGVEIGDNCFIGPRVTFTNDKLPWARNVNFKTRKTVVETFASIGAGAVILPGIRVGKGSMVGAGSVVTKDVVPGTTVAGNPARTLRSPEWGAELTKAMRQAGDEQAKVIAQVYGFDPEIVNE